jgi:hypothetical protein
MIFACSMIDRAKISQCKGAVKKEGGMEKVWGETGEEQRKLAPVSQ